MLAKKIILLNITKSEKSYERKQIVRTWLTGQRSCTLIIPREFATEYGLDKPTNVIVEGTSEGILIRKLEL
jgi:hypothetical protein